MISRPGRNGHPLDDERRRPLLHDHSFGNNRAILRASVDDDALRDAAGEVEGDSKSGGDDKKTIEHAPENPRRAPEFPANASQVFELQPFTLSD